MAKLGTNVDFQPFDDFVLIEPIERGFTDGGVALPEGADVGPPSGRIVRAGPGAVTDSGVRVPIEVAEDDLVYLLFTYEKPTGIEIDGAKYILTRARNLCGKVIKGRKIVAA